MTVSRKLQDSRWPTSETRQGTPLNAERAADSGVDSNTQRNSDRKVNEMKPGSLNTQWTCAILLAGASVVFSGCGGAEPQRAETPAPSQVPAETESAADSIAAMEADVADDDSGQQSGGGFGAATMTDPDTAETAAASDSQVPRQHQPPAVAAAARMGSDSQPSGEQHFRAQQQSAQAMDRSQIAAEEERPGSLKAAQDIQKMAPQAAMPGGGQPGEPNREEQARQLNSPTDKSIARGTFEKRTERLKSAPGAKSQANGQGQPRGNKTIPLSSLLADAKTQKSQLSIQQQKIIRMDLQPGEELWIIAKAAPVTQAATDPKTPRCGTLMATLPNQTIQIPVPLKHTAVEGNIDGYIATVDVSQQFQNPYDTKIEAVYVFPLPQDAAVNDFVMTVGDRKIRGIIRERQKAEQIYAVAKAQGHVAALMTQERPNIFTQKVANIEPGKNIDINIRYFNTLRYDSGAYEFVFPMVVGPRFNPAATADGIGAVARGQNKTSGQKTEVQYLAPNERSGHDISMTLNISAGVDIEDVHSVNHVVDVKNVCESQRKVTLSAQDAIPNKDFVLRYKVAGDQIKTAMLTHKDKNGSYFTMMLYPPADLEQVQRSPMEMVFVLDCSGSMRGKPMAQAKAAISHALQSLTQRDTFQIIQFSNNASQLGAEPVLATEDNIRRGLDYLASLDGGGGTQMIEGIKAALDFPHDEGRFRLVSFMTDGYIGNEQQILATLHDKLGAARIFSFGVGSSPNRMLMDRMAVLGRGAVAYLSLNDNAVEIMDHFNRRISHPAMTDLAIDWGTMNVTDVYPQRLPDLIVGRPVIITGRYEGEASIVKVNGRVDMEPASFAVSLEDKDATADHTGIAAVWARLKIKDLMNIATHADNAAEQLHQTVTQTALAYNLMSAFTAFVAVDSMTKTEPSIGTTVAVPVPVPDGVKYETTVGGTN